MSGKDQIIPDPVIRRLPRYLIRARELRNSGDEWVSSHGLGEALGLTSSTVRQDISHLDLRGVSKRGYAIESLELAIRGVLQADVMHPTVIVGAGNLGCALACNGELAQNGFEACGIFDSDPAVVGRTVGALRVQPMRELRRAVMAHQAEIGIIAVPAGGAQEVAERLVRAGVRGLLNLAYTHIRLPPAITVVDARLLARLQEIAYALRSKDTAE